MTVNSECAATILGLAIHNSSILLEKPGVPHELHKGITLVTEVAKAVHEAMDWDISLCIGHFGMDSQWRIHVQQG